MVSGVRATQPIAALKTEMPRIYKQFAAICRQLEKYYREVQDVAFTIERGKLWMLQTRRQAQRAGSCAHRGGAGQ